MAIYVYVDNSNAFIEGKRVSAVQNGLAPNIFEAMNQGILDNAWRLDFGKLHGFISTKLGDMINKAVLFGSRPPANDSVWNMARQGGFTPVVVDRNVANKEKKVDTGIITELVKDAFTIVNKNQDKLVLVAGDGDFVPAINTLKTNGFETHLFFWGHASQELRNSAIPNFTNLDPELATIGH